MSVESGQCSVSSVADSAAIASIVSRVKSGGIFDQFRRECLSDADTKPSFQNLLQRVEGYVSKFLSQQKWSPNINKNQLRERLRKQINESGMLKYGIEHLVEQVVNYKINSLFWPQIENVVKDFLGIQDIQVIPSQPLPQITKSLSKTNSKSSLKSDENFDMKIKIKDEPIELKPCPPSSDDSSQPMDIESNSNSSVDYKDKEVKLENEENEMRENEMNEDNHDVDCWPTPPKPEMLTPERQTIECHKTSDELQCDDKSESNDFRDCIKQNESFLINKSFMRELKSDIIGDTIAADMRAKDSLQTDIEVKTEESDFSDVSSVHTSDLSDFDDEISLDDSNDESKDNKKNKISLKVVKKMTEVLSNEQIGDQNVKSNQNASKQVSSDEQNIKTNIKSESKRIRKINPKYSSKEFSSIFTEKDVSLPTTSREEADESHNRPQVKTQTESIHRMSSRRRRHSNCSESDGKESNELSANRSSKVAKRLEELPLESRCSSRGSIESSLSETTQDSTQSLNRPKRQPNKQRNESQGQRYDASDLYKPRRLMPSRRRGQTTPDSSTQSNEDFFIHDLSKQ